MESRRFFFFVARKRFFWGVVKSCPGISSNDMNNDHNTGNNNINSFCGKFCGNIRRIKTSNGLEFPSNAFELPKKMIVLVDDDFLWGEDNVQELMLILDECEIPISIYKYIVYIFMHHWNPAWQRLTWCPIPHRKLINIVEPFQAFWWFSWCLHCFSGPKTQRFGKKGHDSSYFPWPW